MKRYRGMKTFGALMMAVLIFLGCISLGAVTAEAATTNVHFTSGKLRGQTVGTYSGEMSGGVPHGKGTIRYAFGATFEGTFKNGEPDGYGVYTYYDGTYTKGDWSWGTATAYLDRDREGTKMTYSGMFCDGDACGMGELSLEKCGTFYGEFFDGDVEGWGIYAYRSPVPEKEPLIDGTSWAMVSGSKKHEHNYTGLTLNGKWQGFGLGVKSNGSYYVGEIRNEYRQGYGRVFMANDSLYQEGTFKSGNLVR